MRPKYYLVQIGVSYSSPCFLPYGTGCIAAYLKNDPEISGAFEVPDIVVMREKICDVLRRFSDPAYVAFSSYAWNYEYNLELAQRLKERFPDVVILFGGHSVPPGGDLLDRYPFIDYLMHNEGEETTAMFLKAQKNGTPLEDVPNLSFRKNGKTVTTRNWVPCDISEYPSPYLEGIFDNLLAEFPDKEFHATLETNRGCPYSCSYCEWCYTKSIRPFPLEKVKKEIEWIASHKLKYCYCADANFGILDRDVEIAQYVVDQKKKYGYPDVFKPCYAKESDDTVFAAGYILNKNNADKGVTMSYQTLDPETLKNIGRKNLTLQRFESLDIRYKNAGIPTYSELILGLPGETYESFCRGICSLLESGQNNSMLVYECQIHPNSPMAKKSYQKRFGIKTARIPMFGIHYNPQFNGVKEYLEIVTETASMPKADWVRAYMFAVVLQAFHHLAMLRFFAIFYHRELHIPYYQFYSDLYSYIFEGSSGFLHELFCGLMRRKADTETADWTYQKEEFGIVGWYFEEGAFLEMVKSGDVFWKEITPFLKRFNLAPQLFDELLCYQRSLIRTLGTTGADIRSHWNFYPYFEDQSGATPLKRVNAHLSVRTELRPRNWAEYAKQVIWYGKRHSVMLLTNIKDDVTYMEEECAMSEES